MGSHSAGKRWVSASVVGTAILMLALGVGPGWACVPQPLISLQPSASGPPGSQLALTGLAFGQGPVEVRWNAVDGPLLAQGSGPTISGPINVPQTPEGLYSIIAFNRAPDGTVGSSSRASFQVTAAGTPTTTQASSPATSVEVPPPSKGGNSRSGTLFTGLAALVTGVVVGATLMRRRRHRVLAE